MEVVRIGRDVLERILRHCVESYPYECCGLMLGTSQEGNRVVIDVVRVSNVHEDDRRVRYMIDPMESTRPRSRPRSEACRLLGYTIAIQTSPQGLRSTT